MNRKNFFIDIINHDSIDNFMGIIYSYKSIYSIK